MKNYHFYKSEQFRHCQATIAYFEDEASDIVIFYSYTCPKIVKIGRNYYKFTFENSRKAGCITSSMTTSKQCNQRLGGNHHDLPTMNLADFEKEYFDTRLEKYY